MGTDSFFTTLSAALAHYDFYRYDSGGFEMEVAVNGRNEILVSTSKLAEMTGKPESVVLASLSRRVVFFNVAGEQTGWAQWDDVQEMLSQWGKTSVLHHPNITRMLRCQWADAA